jgi:hypothetical protein
MNNVSDKIMNKDIDYLLTIKITYNHNNNIKFILIKGQINEITTKTTKIDELEKNKVEREKIEMEKAEKEVVEKDKIEKDKIEKEKVEMDKLEKILFKKK